MMTIEPPSSTLTRALPKSAPKRRLIRACLALLIVGSVALSAAQSPATAPDSGWHLSWSDEFNGPDGSAPDPGKWGIVAGGKGFGNNELESYTARPVNVQ